MSLYRVSDDGPEERPVSEGAFEALEKELEDAKRIRDDNFTEAMALEKKNAEMRATLEEVLETLKDNYDVVDGGDGQPRPNKWMELGQLIEATLRGVS